MPDRIVVLDGYTLTPARPGTAAPPGEPTWEAVASLGELTVYDRTSDDAIVDRARDATAVLTNKTPINDAVFAALPKLRYVGVLATGTNVVDLEAARRRNVTVTNIPAYGPDSVAQHTFALLLALVSRVAEHHAAVRDGQWSRSGDFCFTVAPLSELAGKTLGVIGLGAIGRRVAGIGAAMGMRVASLKRSQARADASLAALNVAWMELDELVAAADVLSLHCPLTPETHHLIDADRLALMKPTAYLLNTGRGPLVDEAALAAALNNGRIGGAGLDVLATEPPADDHPLLAATNCVVTPHIAWATREARGRLMHLAADNLHAFLAGTPTNVVT